MTGTEIRSAMIQARDEYIDIIKSELLGPGSEFSWSDKEHELISSTPTSRYSLGILFPQGNEHGQDNDETLQKDEEGIPEEEVIREYHDTANDPSQSQQQHTFEIDDTADENLDEEIGMATQYWPSSMGITFLVKGEATVVKGRLSFATYRGAGISDCAIPYTPDSPELYRVPTELAHIMEFDKNAMVLKLKSRVTPRKFVVFLNVIHCLRMSIVHWRISLIVLLTIAGWVMFVYHTLFLNSFWIFLLAIIWMTNQIAIWTAQLPKLWRFAEKLIPMYGPSL